MYQSTLVSHIAAAIELQKRSSGAYMVFGKSTPWDNDNNPPTEVEDTEAISEIIGYKKVKQFSLARPLNPGETPIYPTVIYGNQTWVLIPMAQAYAEKARWVYIEAELVPEDFPYGSFRQVGIHLDLVPQSGVNKDNLLPSEVLSTGQLQFYENRKPQNRVANIYVQEQFVIKV